MTSLPAINYLYSLSGFFIGALVGLTGVGGGSLMTPLLLLLFGISPATAVGTDLLYAAITKTAGTLVHGGNRTIDWRITMRLATGSIPATLLTLVAMYNLGTMGPQAAKIITTMLGISLLFTAVSLVARTFFLRRPEMVAGGLSDKSVQLLTTALGFILGVLVTITSVGAGAIGVTALLILYPRLTTVRIVGADIAHAVPLTLIAGLGHWLIGSVDWSLLASLLVGSLPGIALGSYLAARAPERLLSIVLAATLILVGTRLVI